MREAVDGDGDRGVGGVGVGRGLGDGAGGRVNEGAGDRCITKHILGKRNRVRSARTTQACQLRLLDGVGDGDGGAVVGVEDGGGGLPVVVGGVGLLPRAGLGDAIRAGEIEDAVAVEVETGAGLGTERVGVILENIIHSLLSNVSTIRYARVFGGGRTHNSGNILPNRFLKRLKPFGLTCSISM